MRLLKEFLQSNGYETDVLTCGFHSTYGNIMRIADRTDREALKGRMMFLKYLNPLPDSMFIWSFQAADYVRRHHKEYSTVILSYPPFTSALFTALTITAHTRNKFILDAKDPWYDTVFSYYLTFIDRYLDRFFEWISFRQFKDIVVVTEGMLRHYENLYRRKLHLIRNVCSRDENINALKTVSGIDFVFTGKMDRIRKNPAFMRAWDKFASETGMILHVAGPGTDSMKGVHIVNHGILSRTDAARLILSAKYSVVLFNPDEKSMSQFFPSKLYEYLKFKKPVFFAGPESDASEFINVNKIGVSVTDNSVHSIYNGLVKFTDEGYSVPEEISESFSPEIVFEKYLPLLRTAYRKRGGP